MINFFPCLRRKKKDKRISLLSTFQRKDRRRSRDGSGAAHFRRREPEEKGRAKTSASRRGDRIAEASQPLWSAELETLSWCTRALARPWAANRNTAIIRQMNEIEWTRSLAYAYAPVRCGSALNQNHFSVNGGARLVLRTELRGGVKRLSYDH